MYEVVGTIRKVLREDFGTQVSPRTLFVLGVVADAARLADWAAQRLNVIAKINLHHCVVIDRAKCELGCRR